MRYHSQVQRKKDETIEMRIELVTTFKQTAA